MQITNIEPQKKHKNRSSVYIDGSFAFGISDFDLMRARLSVGDTIDTERLDEIRKDILLEDARRYALKLLDRQAYTEKGIRQKLKDHGADESVIEKTILFLKEYRYIDDYEYAARFIKSAVSGGKSGIRKITYDLMQKGIDKKIIDSCLSEIDFDESESIYHILEKKLKGDVSYPSIMKAKRYCLGRGFSASSIDSALQKLTNGQEEWFED